LLTDVNSKQTEQCNTTLKEQQLCIINCLQTTSVLRPSLLKCNTNITQKLAPQLLCVFSQSHVSVTLSDGRMRLLLSLYLVCNTVSQIKTTYSRHIS